jgi:ubiquinone biosynthesis protein
VKRRQQQVEQCLAEYGLARPPRRVSRRFAEGADDDGRCRRLSAALVSLGPVFSSFGIYLSSRADLLPAKNCLELAAIPDRAEPSCADAVLSLMTGELGRPAEEVYASFEDEPFESRLIFQSHRARLRGGEAVTVKVVRAEFEEQLACDLELLPLLNGALADSVVGGALEDFRRTLRQQTDFACEAEMMAELARESEGVEAVRAPTLHAELCTSKVLTVERLSGTNLGDLLSPFGGWEGEGARGATPSPSGIDPAELASLLCLVWLRQSLQGGVFPVDPRPENILVLPSRQIALTGGVFASLPAEVKTNLFNYLVAVAARSPDSACSYLLKEMTGAGRAACEDELRHRVRQVIPFRDGGWGDRGDSRNLAEYLFVQWRFARECGYAPQPHLLSFCRGLFQIAAAARRLAPGRDPLMEALQDLRFNTMFAEFREMVALGRMGESLDRYAAMMTELPQRLNEVLTLAAEGRAGAGREEGEGARRRSRRNSSASMVALLLLLVSVALWSHQLSAAAGAKEWADRAGAVAFILVGALLLRAACRA